MTTEPYDAIVLSGGGLKGIAHCGVLKYYCETGEYDYDSIHTFSGTSIGAAMCLALACGISPVELFRIIYTTPSFFIKPRNTNFLELLSGWGLMSLDPFIDLVSSVVKTKFDDAETMTMKDLYDRTGKTLIVAVSNITTLRGEYLDRYTAPNISVLLAVRMSCSLPIVFPKVMYNDCLYLDGGLSDNIPISKVRDAKKALVSVTTGQDCKSTPTDFLNYVYRVALLPVSVLTKQRYEKYIELDHVTTVVTEINNVRLIDFDVPSTVRMDLFMRGYNEAKWVFKREDIVVEGWSWDVTVGDGWDVTW